MEQFIEQFNSPKGIFDIMSTLSVDEIINVASSIYEMEASELSSVQVECFGSEGKRISYAESLQLFATAMPYWEQIYDKSYDDITRQTLFGLFQYALLPDPNFLHIADQDSSCPNSWTCQVNIIRIDDIRTNMDTIYNMQDNCDLNIDASNVVFDVWQMCYLGLMVNDDTKVSVRMRSTTDITVMVHTSPYQKYTADEAATFNIESNKLRVLSVAGQPDEWTNVQLLKDNGLLPFFLNKNHNCDVTMAGVDRSPYPYHDMYMPDLKMDYLPSGNDAAKVTYVSEHAVSVDLLIVNGLYPVNNKLIEAYYANNPYGRTYLMLDVNTLWTDRFDLKDKSFADMMDKIDVIGVGCRRTQRLLNTKWPWAIEYMPNGWYHPWTKVEAPTMDNKEHTLLTVASIGTPPKASDVMLEAFAMAADRIPGWKLKLVGGIDEGFKGYIDSYFVLHPRLKDRVIFTGPITDKDRLYDEYKKATVFTLTSRLEGAPNVASEALRCGCAIATTDIDAAPDITDEGRCGMIAPIDDVRAIADMYVDICSDEFRLGEMCTRAYQYSTKVYNMEHIVARIYESVRETM